MNGHAGTEGGGGRRAQVRATTRRAAAAVMTSYIIQLCETKDEGLSALLRFFAIMLMMVQMVTVMWCFDCPVDVDGAGRGGAGRRRGATGACWAGHCFVSREKNNF